MSKHDTLIGREFAEKSLEIRGKISPLELGRVADSLSPEGGELQYILTGEPGQQRNPELLLHVQGWLGLLCQRCLGPIRFTLDTQVRFSLVASEAEIPPIELERDDVDYLVVGSGVDLMALIEDEVLLSLPLSPSHDEGQCTDDARGTHEQKESPFKVLQGLKVVKS